MDKQEFEKTDTDIILSSISSDQKRAIQEFKYFSMQEEQINFLDINEDEPWTPMNGVSFWATALLRQQFLTAWLISARYFH